MCSTSISKYSNDIDLLSDRPRRNRLYTEVGLVSKIFLDLQGEGYVKNQIYERTSRQCSN